jgi:hypothetical protein
MPASLPADPPTLLNVVRDGQKAVVVIAVIAWHILDRSFFVSL